MSAGLVPRGLLWATYDKVFHCGRRSGDWKHAELGNYRRTITLPFRTAPCPILTQDKGDGDKEARKGQTWPVFPDNAEKWDILGDRGVHVFA